MKNTMLFLSLVTIVTTVLPAVSNEHSYIAGKPGVNDFTINWTDNRNYTDIDSMTYDVNRGANFQAAYETQYEVRAIDEAKNNVTLFIQISWHPDIERPDTVTPGYFMDADEKWVSDQEDLEIQGKPALLLTYKEQKEYRGSEKEPEIAPAYYKACYFPDSYTEVMISGDLSDWSLSEFRAVLDSLHITPPSGYYS